MRESDVWALVDRRLRHHGLIPDPTAPVPEDVVVVEPAAPVLEDDGSTPQEPQESAGS